MSTSQEAMVKILEDTIAELRLGEVSRRNVPVGRITRDTVRSRINDLKLAMHTHRIADDLPQPIQDLLDDLSRISQVGIDENRKGDGSLLEVTHVIQKFRRAELLVSS
jgi:hypothetical protein